MRIAFVEPHLELYGGIRRIMELSNRLVRLGEEVTIYHPTGAPCRWMKGEAPSRPLGELFDRSHDVVVFNDPPDYRVVRRARTRLKVFYILCLYEREKLGRFNPKILWPKKGRMMSLKRALQMPFYRLANATWMQAYLQDELGIEVELLLGGVNREVFHPVEVTHSDDAFRILCSGDPRARKGMDTIRAAFAIVSSRHPRAVLETYHGKGIPQDDMARTYASADLFVDAQHYAGWNNPVAEAMACGVPVVCTDIGGVADFARHMRTALLVPVGDAQALAEAILLMIREPPLRERPRTAALRRVERFDWDESAKRLQALLHDRVARVEVGPS